MNPFAILKPWWPNHWTPNALLTRLVIKRTKGRVLRGPFKGIRFGVFHGNAITAKLLETYERELHDSFRSLTKIDFSGIVNIGAADGFYVAALGRMFPRADLVAFEAEEYARCFLLQNLSANSIETRVIVRGICTPANLQTTLTGYHRPLVFCDIEGFEVELLDPQRIPELEKCHLLVEIHDRPGQPTGTVLANRFARTHFIKRIDAVPRSASEFPFKTMFTHILSTFQFQCLVSDLRPPGM